MLGCRFIPAILEKHPGAEIHAHLDTEGNPLQENFLRLGYSRLFSSITTIPTKKYKPFWVKTQFGPDSYFGALENVPDEWREKMEKNHDLFLDLHIDSLKFLSYDIPWMRYLYFFPRPDMPEVPEVDKEIVSKLPERFIVCNLVSESSGAHRMEIWWLTGLIRRLASRHPVVILSTPKINHFYEEASKFPNVTVLNVQAATLFTVISRASLMVATDTGLKFIAYGLDVPTLEFSAQSNGPHSMQPSHELRWNLFPRRCFPPHYDIGYVADCAFRVMEEKGYAWSPNIQSIDNQLVRRKWTLDTEKSVLNKETQ